LELLHRYHDATNAGARDELDDIFADDFINFAAGFEPVKSLAAMKTLVRELLVAFPDWHVTEDMFGQDNKVVTRWSLRATHLAPYHDIPATGLKIHAEGIHIDHIVGNKIAKRWACNNFTDVSGSGLTPGNSPDAGACACAKSRMSASTPTADKQAGVSLGDRRVQAVLI